MNNFEFRILEKFLSGMLLGFSYYPSDLKNDFTEFNIYLIFFVFHFKFYK